MKQKNVENAGANTAVNRGHSYSHAELCDWRDHRYQPPHGNSPLLSMSTFSVFLAFVYVSNTNISAEQPLSITSHTIRHHISAGFAGATAANVRIALSTVVRSNGLFLPTNKTIKTKPNEAAGKRRAQRKMIESLERLSCGAHPGRNSIKICHQMPFKRHRTPSTASTPI